MSTHWNLKVIVFIEYPQDVFWCKDNKNYHLNILLIGTSADCSGRQVAVQMQGLVEVLVYKKFCFPTVSLMLFFLQVESICIFLWNSV